MTKKQIIMVIATFLFGFGSAFYIIKTFFPKHKVEKTNTEEVHRLSK